MPSMALQQSNQGQAIHNRSHRPIKYQRPCSVPMLALESKFGLVPKTMLCGDPSTRTKVRVGIKDHPSSVGCAWTRSKVRARGLAPMVLYIAIEQNKPTCKAFVLVATALRQRNRSFMIPQSFHGNIKVVCGTDPCSFFTWKNIIYNLCLRLIESMLSYTWLRQRLVPIILTGYLSVF